MEIEWSLLASRLLNDVLDFVETEYGSITARKVFDKFDANVSSLLRNPNRGINYKRKGTEELFCPLSRNCDITKTTERKPRLSFLYRSSSL